MPTAAPELDSTAVMPDPSRRGARYRPDIQGLRALAVLLVVAYHADLGIPGGYLGVDVFFVLSGFVIAQMLLAELTEHDRIDFRAFYLRRVRRLMPALAVMLAVCLVLAILLCPLGSQKITARTGAAAALLNANTYLSRNGGSDGYFGLSGESNAMLHTWSLSVEEQFYLVVPALIAVTWALARRLRRSGLAAVVTVLAVLLGASFALSLATTYGHASVPLFGANGAFYSSPTRGWEFAAGALLAGPALRGFSIPRRVASVAAWCGAALIVGGAFLFDSATKFPGVAALVPVFGSAALILAGMTAEKSMLTRGLSIGPAQRLGDLSYGWYLWHWPAIVFAAALFPGSSIAKTVGAVVSLGVAGLSYRLVETPIRFRVRPSPRRTAVLAFGCVLVPLVAAFGLVVGNREVGRLDRIQQFALHSDVERGCDSPTPLGDRGTLCTWQAVQAVGDAVLVGDSNAGQFTEGFVAAANALGLNATVATMSSCPFIGAQIVDRGAVNVRCERFVSRTVSELVARKPRVVVVASASDSYINSDRFGVVRTDGSGVAGRPDEKVLVWQAALGTTLRTLAGAGISTIVVHPVPRQPAGWAPRASAPLRLLGPAGWSAASVDRIVAMDQRTLAVGAEDAAVRGSARVLDLFDELCATASECPARLGGEWLYRDESHISKPASALLASTFRSAIERAVAP